VELRQTPACRLCPSCLTEGLKWRGSLPLNRAHHIPPLLELPSGLETSRFLRTWRSGRRLKLNFLDGTVPCLATYVFTTRMLTKAVGSWGGR